MEVSALRLNLLRGMYLLIAVGLGLTIWPQILFPSDSQADVHTVVEALLGALAVMCMLGLRYPLKMLPLLIFEFLWKLIWVVAFAYRMWRDTGLDSYAAETLFACVIGLVLVPIVLPWGYVFERYFKAKGEPWIIKGNHR
ncbi:hypothetical protein [Lacimicrobium alkaliphilum]|uniref:Uncharacterized protein n=1 Tax=Lacimicrobium alkaliphilum TaxID=1526571 RepID=A0A0U2Z6K1_9ALTE|nr:hypothetical protein [Lacimicrobium alkaliphilum]ALS98084.1 hypothetical protein AT746_07275 [Lacimicrobium alkaliphilum]